MRPETSPTVVPPPGARFVWWLHPTLLCVVVLLPAYLVAWQSGVESGGEVSTARGFYYLHGDIAWLGLAGLAALAIGTLSPIRPEISSRNAGNWIWIVPSRVLAAIGVAALLGYAYWFKDLILHPGMIVDAVLHSASMSYALRASVEKSAGLASLAQLGLPFLLLYCHQYWASDRSTLGGTHRMLAVAIVVAIAFRAVAWAERVAVIEAMAGVVLVWASFARPADRRVQAWLPYFPLAAIVAVVVMFAAGEYFRSWAAHYSTQGLPFWQFIEQRLTNYYFTALNTGAGRLTELEWPTYDFVWTLRWLHKLPLVGSIFTYYTHARPDGFLQHFGDPEFNNPSGVFSIFLDLGLVGGLVLLLAVGVFAKFTYGYWARARTVAGLSYFLFLMTLLEFFRYFYLGDSRCFMVVLGLAAGIALSRRKAIGAD